MIDARTAWSEYWTTGSGEGCLPGAPPEIVDCLRRTWTDFAMGLPVSAAILDIAAGDGAVIRHLSATRDDLVLAGVDSAQIPDDIKALGIMGEVNAAALPFADATFDGVTSQFGIEYCPHTALAEAMRVLKPGGTFAFVCHHADSVAIAHNGRRLAAMEAMARAGLFTLARDMAKGGHEDIKRAHEIAKARHIHSGQTICTELPMALGQALQDRNPAQYVHILTQRARAEMARLTAMLAAARKKGDIEAMGRRLEKAGASVRITALCVAQDQPIAWHVTGKRHNVSC